MNSDWIADEPETPWLQVAGHALRSRLLVGIEQYDDPVTVTEVLRAARADVFITTYDLEHTRSSLALADLDEHADLDAYTWVGTTSFAHSADAAVRTCQHLRNAFGIEIIKLDVRDAGNGPDVEATIVAAKELLADGFAVMPFIPPDRDAALALQDLGCAAVRLMAAPVASYQGIIAPAELAECIGALTVPAIVEGGIGSPADVTHAMELGAEAVLVNTLIARANRPPSMAASCRHALLAGCLSAAAR